MVKQKLTDAEEKQIEEQLKLFVKPKTLPDIMRKAILNNKWIPDKYEIYIPKGTLDDEDHFVIAEDAIKDFENNNMSELDKIAIQRILEVPKISQRLDYEYRGLVTKVKNSLIGNSLEDKENKAKLREKPEEIDLFGNKKTKPSNPIKDIKDIIKKEEEHDNRDEKPYSGNNNEQRSNTTTAKAEAKATNNKSGIDFKDEDY